ncbi:hypothetical protein BDW02DRAFT_571620 [Decorospora gaudefroyi]|uniref:Uncharacterized protein n=1 Tax=Decorospora gaudefroyi TaxID=184978 RepID=A0A6A5K4D9_9PLEO|nr:hypothetical protein BDW02DRAFT_571620 [Decorospora gaudefroyi]
MPRRQLPWANKGSGSRIQIKPTSTRKAAKQRAVSAIDDDFFDGPVVGSNSNGKGRAHELDDELQELPTEPSTPRTRIRTKDTLHTAHARAQSSSPPPFCDFEPPQVEAMYKGVSKFDLRDDEWMMVEDEFLETAKLFTRHLHIAEYEKLKKMIEEKKKEAKVARPVVAGARRSIEGAFKEKAKVQEQRQKQAIRDVFESKDSDEEDEQDMISTRTSLSKATSSFSVPRRTLVTAFKRSPQAHAAQDSESEDLDAPRPRAKSASNPSSTIRPLATRANAEGGSMSASSRTSSTKGSQRTFAKPQPPPVASNPRSRMSRATPFDMLDDWVPKKLKPLPTASPAQQSNSRLSRSTTPVKAPSASRTPSTSKVPHSFDFDDLGSGKIRRSTGSFDDLELSKSHESSSISKETADRLAKRKIEREKQEKEKKRKTAKLDDIPTFLF